MAKSRITISEALTWLKTLEKRHQELVTLRNTNSVTTTHYYNQSQHQEVKPMYDVKKLDSMLAVLAREIRLCETAIKRANAKTYLPGYLADDEVLGELQ